MDPINVYNYYVDLTPVTAQLVEQNEQLKTVVTQLETLIKNQALFQDKLLPMLLCCIGIVAGAVIGKAFVDQWRA